MEIGVRPLTRLTIATPNEDRPDESILWHGLRAVQLGQALLREEIESLQRVPDAVHAQYCADLADRLHAEYALYN